MKNWESLEGKTIVLSNRGHMDKIISYLRRYAQESATDPKIKDIAHKLSKLGNPVQAVFNYAYDSIVYTPDPDNIQDLRFAQNSIRTGQGNCTDYAILISALLTNLQIPHYLRVVAYDRPSQKEHIYVVTANGIILDPVIGQKQDGTDTRTNRNIDGFYNKELPYKAKTDYNMYPQVRGLGSNRFMADNKAYSSVKRTQNSKSKSLGCGCGGGVGVHNSERNTNGCQCDHKPTGIKVNDLSRKSKDKIKHAMRTGQDVIYRGKSVKETFKRLGLTKDGNEGGGTGTDEEDEDSGSGSGSSWWSSVNWGQAANTTGSAFSGVFSDCASKCGFLHPFSKTKREACKQGCSPVNTNAASGTGGSNMSSFIVPLLIGGLGIYAITK